MAKDIQIIIKRLLDISSNVISGFEMLAQLSYNDKEKTIDFDYCLNEVKKYLNTEAIILNNLDLASLYAVIKALPDYDDDSMIYERTYVNVDDKIEELQNSCEYQESESDEEITIEPHEIDDDGEFEVTEYFLNDEENSKDEFKFINYINILALKKIKARIMETYTDNSSDQRYKKSLLNHLKVFKYLVLAQNNKLEKLGVDYRFDIKSIPEYESPEIDASIIAYNHCIIILEKLYDPPQTNDHYDDTSISLFNMICFELYLNYVSEERLEKLQALCQELKVKSKNRFIGDIAENKILIKSKN